MLSDWDQYVPIDVEDMESVNIGIRERTSKLATVIEVKSVSSVASLASMASMASVASVASRASMSDQLSANPRHDIYTFLFGCPSAMWYRRLLCAATYLAILTGAFTK